MASADPVQRSSLDLARRYSRFVRGMRYVLPVLALTVLGLILLWPSFAKNGQAFHLTFANLDSSDAELRMIAPKLTGRDTLDRPYTVTAKTAVPDSKDPDRWHLDIVDGDMTMTDGTWVNLSAPGGIYDRVLRQLELSGPIALHDDRGYELAARSALIDLKEGTASTEEPVQMQGAAGTLTADRGRAVERGIKFFFDGHAHVVLFPESGRPSDPPTDITADHTEFDRRTNEWLFTGNVVVVQGADRLTCDWLKAYLKARDQKPLSERDQKPITASGTPATAVDKVEAKGSVFLTTPQETAKAAVGSYDVAHKRIVLTGGVVLTRGPNVSHGAMLVSDLATGKSVLDPEKGTRIESHFVPEKAKAK